jgi:hypothetical protein
MGHSGWTHFEDCEIVRSTEKAILVRFEGGEEKWVPRSQIADSESLQDGDVGQTVSITDWFAEKEGLG